MYMYYRVPVMDHVSPSHSYILELIVMQSNGILQITFQ